MAEDNRCNNCNAIMEPDDKFCLMCGYPRNYKRPNTQSLNKKKDEIISNFQESITNLFGLSKVSDLFYKYAVIFAAYYVVYLLACRISDLDGLTNSLYVIQTPTYYLYLVALIILFAKKDYLVLMGVLGVRLLDVLIYVLQNDGQLTVNLVTKALLCILLMIMVIMQFNREKSYPQKQTSCPKCGVVIAPNNSYCQNCGTKVR